MTMRVFGYATDPEAEWTRPLPMPSQWFKARLLGGDYCAPKNKTGSYARPSLWHQRRAYCSWRLLPFLSWRYPFSKRGGYCGFKVWGINGADDVAAYLLLIGTSADEGARAVHLSARLWAAL